MSLARRLRRLDRQLHIDHRGRSEWIWLAPALTFLVVLGVTVFVGVISHVPAGLFVPVAVIIAIAITSISIGYMTPDSDYLGPDGGEGRDGGEERPSTPQPPSPTQERASEQQAPAWYRRLDESGPDERTQRPARAGKPNRSST